MKRMAEKFESTGSNVDVKHTTWAPSSRSETNIAGVWKNVDENPESSIRLRAKPCYVYHTLAAL